MTNNTHTLYIKAKDYPLYRKLQIFGLLLNLALGIFALLSRTCSIVHTSCLLAVSITAAVLQAVSRVRLKKSLLNWNSFFHLAIGSLVFVKVLIPPAILPNPILYMLVLNAISIVLLSSYFRSFLSYMFSAKPKKQAPTESAPTESQSIKPPARSPHKHTNRLEHFTRMSVVFDSFVPT